MKSSFKRSGRAPSDSRLSESYTAEELIERAVNEARKLPSYDERDDEPTARQVIPQDIHFHVHQPSAPEIEIDATVEVGPVKVSGLPRWAVIGIGGVVAALVALLAALRGH